MKREGFTLIELLIVIAVITLMTALLLSTLRPSKLRAEAVLCGIYIRQQVISLTMYENDNGTFPYSLNLTDDALSSPPSGGYAGNATQDSRGWWWFNYISDYSRKNRGEKEALWCPSRKINDINIKRNVLCANYGVNQSICKSTNGKRSQAEFFGRSLSKCDIQRHSETLLIVDSGYSIINWWHVTNAPPELLGNSIKDAAYLPGLKINEKKKIWPGLEWDATTSRHPINNVNAGYVDGHVKSITTDDLFVERTQDGYRNLHPLWQPLKSNN